MRTLGSICAVVLGLTIAGCGDDDDSPEEQCKDLFAAVCSKAAECVAEAGGGSEDTIKKQCLSQADETCKDVGEPPDDVDVDDCIDDIEDTSCDDFETDTLPNSCGD